MAALTKNRSTPERVPALRQFESAGEIYAGALVALNSSGKAVPASDTAGLRVLGRAETRAKTGEMVTVRSGCFLFKNGSSTAALATADTGGVCYVIDDQTVGKTGGTNSIAAGLVYDVENRGVWVLTGAQPVTVNITTQPAG